MPTPFPGVDPYLERATLWPDVHQRLLVALANALGSQLRPRYYIAVEERIYTVEPIDMALIRRADVAVMESASSEPSDWITSAVREPTTLTVELPMPEEQREPYLVIWSAQTDQVITELELLSPSNKRPGEGRDQFLRKRLQILGSGTHYVEIDLLRGGQPMPVLHYTGTSDYRIVISRVQRRPRAELLAFGVRQPIPPFHLPLQAGDVEPEIDLNTLLHATYDQAGYDMRIDYSQPPEPPLSDVDMAWARALIDANV